jgi:phosphohistidine phosphatase
MRLVLFRHGPAGRSDPDRWPDDRLRPLSPRGEQRSHAAACGLLRTEREITAVWSSPLERALQTARILCAELPGEAEVVKARLLAPGESSVALIRALATESPAATLVLVGHEPDLGKLAGTLLFGAPAAIPLGKAGACAIEFEGLPRAGAGRLEWFLPPRLLRRAARKQRV